MRRRRDPDALPVGWPACSGLLDGGFVVGQGLGIVWQLVLALEGRRSIARGKSPWEESRLFPSFQPQRGDGTVAPPGL
jgi:hypothetical protein